MAVPSWLNEALGPLMRPDALAVMLARRPYAVLMADVVESRPGQPVFGSDAWMLARAHKLRRDAAALTAGLPAA